MSGRRRGVRWSTHSPPRSHPRPHRAHGVPARLAELDDELATARADADLANQRRAIDEREQLLAGLRRATRPDGTPRALGTSAAERIRKAVTARLRDAIRRITEAAPEVGIHLDRAIRTGTTCRYDP